MSEKDKCQEGEWGPLYSLGNPFMPLLDGGDLIKRDWSQCEICRPSDKAGHRCAEHLND